MTDPNPSREQRRSRSAGAFDIRNFIGALIGIYGIILVVLGLASFTEVEQQRTGGVNANLVAGICMVVFAGAMLLWARLRPIQIPPADPAEDPGGEE